MSMSMSGMLTEILIIIGALFLLLAIAVAVVVVVVVIKKKSGKHHGSEGCIRDCSKCPHPCHHVGRY